MSRCIQCNRTPTDLGPGAIFLTRRRPMGNGEYQICLGCARRVREEQEERAQAAIEVAERAGA